MNLRTGTPDTKTEHSQFWGLVGILTAFGIPVAFIFAGVAAEGLGAVSWAESLLWGAVAMAAFLLFMAFARKINMTNLSALDLTGGLWAESGSEKARRLGAIASLGSGALLGLSGSYFALLIGYEFNWLAGFAWGLFLWAFSLILLSSLGIHHPNIRRGKTPDPGVWGVHCGRLTPLALLIGFAIYGQVLGALYQLS